jgi:hypothetical protein
MYSPNDGVIWFSAHPANRQVPVHTTSDIERSAHRTVMLRFTS